jgi:NAD+ kinase
MAGAILRPPMPARRPSSKAKPVSARNGAKLAFVAAETKEAMAALKTLKKRYGGVPPEKADVIVALGGDGFMLRTLHRYQNLGTPIYGMNRGTVGFLMNDYRSTGLTGLLQRAHPIKLHPLQMVATNIKGTTRRSLAINEVSLLRETRQTARIAISIDGKQRLDELICDGVMVATAAGSTAYNLSAYGPILPLGSSLLALTPISAFRPRRWRGALLPHTATVEFTVLNPEKRPVSAVADGTEVRDVVKVTVTEASNITLTLLFDPEHNLEERIIKEQFQP